MDIARKLIGGLLLAGSLTACQSIALKPTTTELDSAQVKALFSGQTVESYNLNTRLTSFTYYQPNGRLLQERLWRKRQGKWWVKDNGEICLKFGKRASCRRITRSGERYYKLRDNKKGEPERIVRYRYFEPGNALARRRISAR